MTVEVRFLTPLGAAFAFAALLPLAVYVRRERRAHRVRGALGLSHPPRRSLLSLGAALTAVPALLALAAMQPVIETTRTVQERIDAEAFVIMDVSRSMLASSSAGAPTRLERAREQADLLRERLPEVPVGLISLTDRLLPHLFPTTDRGVFRSTLSTSIEIERPPPALFFSTRATQLSVLAGIPQRGYFSPSAKKRLLVVLTDGESQPVDASLAKAFSGEPPVKTLLVHVWGRAERIYEAGVPERRYAPDPASAAMLERVAELVGGRVIPERAAGDVGPAAAELLGSGPTRERVLEGKRRALMPYATLAALLPLGFVLVRRSL